MCAAGGKPVAASEGFGNFRLHLKNRLRFKIPLGRTEADADGKSVYDDFTGVPTEELSHVPLDPGPLKSS